MEWKHFFQEDEKPLDHLLPDGGFCGIFRTIGSKVYNFSRGGMTAKEYLESFAEANDFWNPEKACQAYIIALGVNDIINRNMELGSVEDIAEDYRNNKETFAGYYAAIQGAEFQEKFWLNGHLNPCGYVLTAKMVMSYMDYIIRHNITDFEKIGFVGRDAR